MEGQATGNDSGVLIVNSVAAVAYIAWPVVAVRNTMRYRRTTLVAIFHAGSMPDVPPLITLLRDLLRAILRLRSGQC